jgi:predicted ATP-grasp superfamily ATP-dependent carboligase
MPARPESVVTIDRVSDGSARPGVVVLGGAHGTLALARSLGRRGVTVWTVSNDTPLPGWSRHVRRRFEWPGVDAPEAIPFLRDLAIRSDLRGALLVAGGDAEVRFAAQSIDALGDVFRVMLPPWERLKWACEKPLLYRKAAELGLDIPATYEFDTRQEAVQAEIRFPVILKPNMGGGEGLLARAKVMRADDRQTFLAIFGQAANEIGARNIVVQQLVPGGGEGQFSYCALWQDGRPLAEFTARRARQYPVDFGYTSTFVETIDEPAARVAARRLLADIGHHGLVEVEFKRDPRDGTLKLLDVNPRPWSWFGLAAAAGLDLGAMLWDMENGRPARPAMARNGTAWMYAARDMAAAATLSMRGQLSVRAYLASLASVRTFAAFAVSDPLPGLIDLPLTAWRVARRRLSR